ncbi:putative potassium transporter 14 [Ananas comosus]|uniref:Putative potassium transporter 14 n=1 Tax=Ananas comosus TaxID=4615 RepID=A0A199UPI8_ANACO|nr:putative potassium transporter 14 [Ananas comosus]
MAESFARANGGGMRRVGSMEWRWVSQEVNDAEEGEEAEEEKGTQRGDMESEEEDEVDQKLIRTSPRIDWFDVEALEVTGMQKNEDEEFDLGRTMVLTLQTLGVVFGDVGTSPLYTFDMMFNKCPIRGDDDVIGALSLVLYTLILIPLVKYVLVVLWGNDDGEGGTFALYSLICRNAKVSLLPNQIPSDARLSSFRLKVPSPELERSLKVKEHLESSEVLKKLLLVLVLFGTSMVIANGVVTPTMSVTSAASGLKVEKSNFPQDKVVMISVALLIIMFSVQKYATSKVGLVVGPALLIWFFSLGGIGTYNLIKYGSTVFKAFNPVHIYYYFERNSSQAWLSLGGCILCATGSEAIFADLCYFSVRSVQFTFVFLVLPCLLLGYLGQAAFLVANQTTSDQIFFSSLPSKIYRSASIAELGVMMMTTVLVTIVMILIWQINIFLVVSFVTIFLGLELIFFSSVLASVGDGSWVLLLFAAFLFSVMYIWNYGSKLKYESEVKQKLPMDLMRKLGCNLGTVRAPGIGVVCNELMKGIPAIFGHFLTTLPAIHSMIIFVSVKYVPVPVVPQEERFLFKRICPRSYHMFRCIARYGYKDGRKENHRIFEQLLIDSLEKFIRKEAQERSLQSESDYDSDDEEERSHSRIVMAPNGSLYSLDFPLLGDFVPTRNSSSEASTSSQKPQSSEAVPDYAQNLELELSFIEKAKVLGVVYLLGNGTIRARKDSWFFKKLVINYFYAFLRRNCRRGITTMSIPHTHLLQVRKTYMV